MNTILLTGASGQVGWELRNALAPLGRVIAADREQLDLASAEAIRTTIRAAAPAIIINAAAYTAVDKAESEPALAMQVNAVAPGVMAEEALRVGALLVHFSTDYVFDGRKTTPYVESDATHPLSIYGSTKLAGEHAIAASGCRHLILRTSWVYSARRSNFVLTMLKLARECNELAVVTDQVGSPTWAKALAKSTAALLQSVAAGNTATGLYHLSAAGSASRHELVRRMIELARESGGGNTWANLLIAKTADFPLPAARPPYSVLDNGKIHRDFGIEMLTWEEQLSACLRELADP